LGYKYGSFFQKVVDGNLKKHIIKKVVDKVMVVVFKE